MKKKPNVAIIGANGFIGSSLARYFLKRKKKFGRLTLVTRTKIRNHNKKNKAIIARCDHLNGDRLKRILKQADVIYHTAGLAWQHIGESDETKTGLLIRQIIQNSLSAYMIGKILKKEQTLVWISTSAIDVMRSTLSYLDRVRLEDEVERMVECILARGDLSSDSHANLEGIAWDLISKHIVYSFPHALEFSYAYSKYLGQRILEQQSQGNIKILKVSDVYGPGQLISEKIINPNFRARRIQRFTGACALIKNHKIGWIPGNGKNLHGFSRKKSGKITQKIRNDLVFPTYITDVIDMMVKTPEVKTNKIVFNVAGNKISNKNLVNTIREFFHVKVEIQSQKSNVVTADGISDDLHFFNLSRDSLITFEEGLQLWMKKKV